MSHSHYRGGPAEWTTTDRALARAYRAYAPGTCDSCGTRPEWWDPKQGGDRDAFVADIERCEGCSRKAELQAQIPNTEKGVHVILVPKAVYEEAHAHD